MAEYARFYKSDLHMHSPLDKSWHEDTTKAEVLSQQRAGRY